MKRSTQVSLVLMGAVGIGSAAYTVGDYCHRLREQTLASGQQEPTCRSSGWHAWGYGHGWSSGRGANFFSGSGSGFGFGASGADGAGRASAASVGSGSRGGFGSIGASLGGARG